MRGAFDVARRQLIGLALREDIRYDGSVGADLRGGLRRDPLAVASEEVADA